MGHCRITLPWWLLICMPGGFTIAKVVLFDCGIMFSISQSSSSNSKLEDRGQGKGKKEENNRKEEAKRTYIKTISFLEEQVVLRKSLAVTVYLQIEIALRTR